MNVKKIIKITLNSIAVLPPLVIFINNDPRVIGLVLYSSILFLMASNFVTYDNYLIQKIKLETDKRSFKENIQKRLEEKYDRPPEQPKSFSEHPPRYEENNALECPLCDFSTNDMYELDQHVRHTHKKKITM